MNKPLQVVAKPKNPALNRTSEYLPYGQSAQELKCESQDQKNHGNEIIKMVSTEDGTMVA